jgi:hypothetical protein
MKNTKHLSLPLFVSLLLICVPVSCLAVDLQLQPGVTFDWLKDNHGNSASQLTFPLQFTGSLDNLSFRLMTGYTRTSLSTDTKDISMSNLLDTKIGATYRLSDKLPFELLLGLDLNLPTGKTKLSSDETALVMDPDLLPINKYGEGFNINPTVTAAKGWNNWTFALGLGYLWRGTYDFSDALKEYKPGMVFNTIAEARYYYRPKSYARLFTGFTFFGTDTAQGHDTFKEGNVLQIGGSVFHVFTPEIRVSGGLSGTFRGDVTVYDAASGTKQNQSAFNGNENVLDLAGSYALNSKTTLSVPFQVRLTSANSNSSFPVGAKQKVSLGAGATREIIPKLLSADVTLKGYYKHDAAAGGIEAANYTGLGIAASVTGRF